MLLKFHDATAGDAPMIAALHNAAAGALTARFGEGHWSTLVTERGAVQAQRHARVRVGREGGRMLTVVRLATRKAWAIDLSYFTPVRRPLYLTGLAVAAAWPADAIRLDAYDHEAGAGPFYVKCGFVKCGFEERGRVVYKGDPLVYYELLLPVSGGR